MVVIPLIIIILIVALCSDGNKYRNINIHPGSVPDKKTSAEIFKSVD
jgi:hypothetical protein